MHSLRYVLGISVLLTLLSAFSEVSDSHFAVQAQPLPETSQINQADGDKFLEVGIQQYRTGYLNEGLSSCQEALKLYHKQNDRRGVVNSLNAIAEAQILIGKFDQALEVTKEALQISRELNMQDGEARALINMAALTLANGQFEQAFEEAQLAVDISQKIGNPSIEGLALVSLGGAYSTINQNDQALIQINKALVISQEIGDRYLQNLVLINLGQLYLNIGQYDAAKQILEGALQISKEIDARPLSFNALTLLGVIDINLGEYDIAEEKLVEAQAIAQAINSPIYEASILTYFGIIYLNRGLLREAIQVYEQAIAQFEELGGNSVIKASTYTIMAPIYNTLGETDKALQYLNEAIDIARATNNDLFIAIVQNNASPVYFNLGRIGDALTSAEEALALFQDLGNLQLQSLALNNIGVIYFGLGQYEKAIEAYEQVLPIFRELGNQTFVAMNLNNLGLLYSIVGLPDLAIINLQEALDISRQINNPSLEGLVLNQLGMLFLFDGIEESDLDLALDYFKQAVTLANSNGFLGFESGAISNIGMIYLLRGQYDLALQYFQQGLILAEQSQTIQFKALILANIGLTYVEKQEPEVAIVILKEAVNVWEQIRAGNLELSQELRQSYDETIIAGYRQLADLLIDQGRLSEAQQVLELLKKEELREFTRSNSVEGEIGQIPLADIEKAILEEFTTFSNFTFELSKCEQNECDELEDLLSKRRTEFRKEVDEFRKILRDRLKNDLLLRPDQINNTARDILKQEPGTVLVYPVVLEDKIRLLLAIRVGESGVIFRDFEVKVDQETLWSTVFELRDQISITNGGIPVHDSKTVQGTASTIYKWLIQPLKPELKQIAEQENLDSLHLVFALDRQTRYIPMAVLFDDEQQEYLIEQHAVSTIVSADLTDVSKRLSSNRNETATLAVGVSEAIDDFSALQFVPSEIDAVVQDIGEAEDLNGAYLGKQFLNDQFTNKTLRDNLAGNHILHIATHARFETGQPENSFLLSGEGKFDTYDIADLGNYGLGDVHMVVLSACETAKGGPDQSGIEIPGISYYFLGNGADSVMASLWLVNDCSTSLLMEEFYEILSQGKVTKAEALQQAQLSLLNSEDDIVRGCSERFFNITPREEGASIPQGSDDGYAHPYYWAPFIIIGNGF